MADINGILSKAEKIIGFPFSHVSASYNPTRDGMTDIHCRRMLLPDNNCVKMLPFLPLLHYGGQEVKGVVHLIIDAVACRADADKAYINDIVENIGVTTMPATHRESNLYFLKQNVDTLLKKIVQDGILGEHVSLTYTIEFQKRGAPHIHLLIWIKDFIASPDNIDKVYGQVHKRYYN